MMSEEFNITNGESLAGKSETPSCPECGELEMVQYEDVSQDGGTVWECPVCYHRMPIEEDD